MVNKVALATAGVLWFIFAIMITIQTWDWFVTISELILDDFYLILYWLSAFSIGFLLIFWIPFMLVVKSHDD